MISFVYVLPMIVAISVYQNGKFTLRVGGVATLINVIYIVMQFMQSDVSKDDIVNYEIQIALMLLVVGFSAITSFALEKLNAYKMSIILDEKERVENILNQIVIATERLNESANRISEEAHTIEKYGSDSRTAIEDIVEGTSELASTIQNQMNMTENISVLTGETASMMEQVKQRMEETSALAESGAEDMFHLEKKSNDSKESGIYVREKMDNLVEKTREVREILVSNTEIGQSVEALSAFSQELIANTENTREMTNVTLDKTKQISELLEQIMNEILGLTSLVTSKDEMI